MAKYVNDKQLADRYGVSRATVWNWSKLGVLPRPKKVGPNTTRWDDDEIARHEAEREGAA